jgi:hypothetical protein
LAGSPGRSMPDSLHSRLAPPSGIDLSQALLGPGGNTGRGRRCAGRAKEPGKRLQILDPDRPCR